VLEIVEHQEELALMEEIRDSFGQGEASAFLHAERPADRRKDEGRVGNGCQRHEESTVREVVEQVRRSLQRKPSLAGTARPGQRQQPHVRASEQVDDIGQLLLATNQRSRLRRKVRRPVVEGRERGKVVVETLGDKLEDPLCPRQVFQPMRAEVAQSELIRQILLNEVSCGLRDEHLAAVTCCANSRPPVQVHPHVALVGSDWLSGVDTDPHAYGAVGERSLRVGCGDNSILRARESDEKRVALCVNLGAAMIGERLPQHLAVGGEGLRVVIPELVQQLGRPLDVGEEERDSSGREVGHPPQ
jgi:hypothetical protein